MAATTQQIKQAVNSDLLERIKIVAQITPDVGQTTSTIETDLVRILATDIGANATLASVYEYAVAQYAQLPPRLTPGWDSTYIQDAQIVTALRAVYNVQP